MPRPKGSKNVKSDVSEKKQEEMPTPKVDKALLKVREYAIKLGLDKDIADKVNDIDVLLGMAAALQKKDERVVSLDDKEDPKEKKMFDNQFKSKVNRMYKKLMSQPKVSYMLALEGKEKPGVIREINNKGRFEQVYVSGAVVPVQLNGYKYLVPKGVMVEIPKQVAEVLSLSQTRTSQAGKDFLLDRTDPRTGQTVSDALA